ncbi:MAG: flavodoxin domain-containing protein [Promethearchaeota archaeon]
MKKVLIVYGTRYGSTEEVSNKIVNTLKEKAIDTSVINFKDLITENQPNLEDYDGIIIGSGIKVGQWTKETKKFVENNLEFFKNSNVILGVFVSSGLASNPEKIVELKKEYIENVLNQYGIVADLYDVFGGVLDLSKDSNIGFLGKKMIKMVSKDDPRIKPNQRNDLRDWNQIKKFTENYANLLKN